MKIEKSIIRDVKDGKSSLIRSPDIFLNLSIFSFLVIFGIETYYRNVMGEPGTIYLTGFWTWVIGGLLVFFIYQRRRSVGRFRDFFKNSEGKIREILEISEAGLRHEIEGYAATDLSWTSLTTFKKTKSHIEVIIGGISLHIPRSILDEAETEALVTLLERKRTEQIGSGNSG